MISAGTNPACCRGSHERRPEAFYRHTKDTEKEDPQGEDLYEVGLLAVVRQVVKLQKNIMRVLIEGIGRAEIYEYTQTADYMQARVIVYDQGRR